LTLREPKQIEKGKRFSGYSGKGGGLAVTKGLGQEGERPLKTVGGQGGGLRVGKKRRPNFPFEGEEVKKKRGGGGSGQ